MGLAVRRSYQDKIIDAFLTLYLIYDVFKHLRFLEMTRVQKLVFLSEWKMIDNRRKGFNFNFVKLLYGPYSRELQNTISKLIMHGLLNDSDLRPTKLAMEIIDDFNDVLRRNEEFIRVIQEINRNYSKVPLQELLEEIYDMPHPYIKGKTIREVAIGTQILYTLKKEKAISAFKITEDEFEDLAICIDPKIQESLTKAMESIRNKHLKTHEEVFGAV
ncbi:MAG: hypothetical protein DRP08_07740 [Candidatus Aenigmatarchaeota archaeon]|nr:MAG: hypothetical protein DRP08_07740 [Candidatus Aenigmarchaeota archaeon]